MHNVPLYDEEIDEDIVQVSNAPSNPTPLSQITNINFKAPRQAVARDDAPEICDIDGSEMQAFDQEYMNKLRQEAESQTAAIRASRARSKRNWEQTVREHAEPSARMRGPSTALLRVSSDDDEGWTEEDNMVQQQAHKRIKQRGQRKQPRAWMSNEVNPDDDSFLTTEIIYKDCIFDFPFEIELLYQHQIEELENYNAIHEIHKFLRLLVPAQTMESCSQYIIITETEKEVDDMDEDYEDDPDDLSKKTLFDVCPDIVRHHKWSDGGFDESDSFGQMPPIHAAYLYLYGLDCYSMERACKQLDVLDDDFLNTRRKVLQQYTNTMQWALYIKGQCARYVLRRADSGLCYSANQAMKLIVDSLSIAYNVVHSMKSWHCFRTGQDHSTDIVTLESHVQYSEFQYVFMMVCQLLTRWGHRLNSDGLICSELVNHKNQPTFFWKEQMTVRAFLEKHITITENAELWQMIKGKHQARLEQEMKSRNEQTPVIYVRRSAFSYENGVFDADTLRFYSYDNNNDVQQLYNMPPPSDSGVDRDGYDAADPANQPFTCTNRMCTSKFFSQECYGKNSFFQSPWEDHLDDMVPGIMRATQAIDTMAALKLSNQIAGEEYDNEQRKVTKMFQQYMVTSTQFRKSLLRKMKEHPNPNSPYHKWYAMMTDFHRWAYHSSADSKCDLGCLCDMNNGIIIQKKVDTKKIKETMDFYSLGPFDKSKMDDPKLWGSIPSSFLEIPTPNIDKVFADQMLPPAVLVMWFVFVGRLMYDINSVDKWQMTTYFEGLAGTGKSSLMILIDHIFDKKFVASISSGSRSDFWGSNMLGKFIAMCGDVGEKWNADQALLQQMISGERVSIEPKGQTVLNLDKWICHIIMSGNVFPKFHDTANAIPRRFMMFNFNYIIKECLSGFETALIHEVPAMLLKASIMYRWAIVYYGRSDLYRNELLPFYFKKSMKNVKLKINPLFDFITDSKMSRMIHLAKFTHRRKKTISSGKSLYFYNAPIPATSDALPKGNLEVWDLAEFLHHCGVINFLVRAYIELTNKISCTKNASEFQQAYNKIPSLFKLPNVPSDLLSKCGIHQNCELERNSCSWKKPSLAALCAPNSLIDLCNHVATVQYKNEGDRVLFKKEFFDSMNLAFQFMRSHTTRCPLSIKQRAFYYLFNSFCTPLDTFNNNFSIWAARRKIIKRDATQSSVLTIKDTNAIELFKRIDMQFTEISNLGYKKQNPLAVVLGMSMCNFKCTANIKPGTSFNSRQPNQNNGGGHADGNRTDVEEEEAFAGPKPILLSDVLGAHTLAHTVDIPDTTPDDCNLLMCFPPQKGCEDENTQLSWNASVHCMAGMQPKLRHKKTVVDIASNLI